MSSQSSVEKQVNEELKVFSNKKLMKIIRNMMYDESIIYLDVDLAIEDGDFVYILHYNYNIIGHEIADAGELETKNISFSKCDTEDFYNYDKPKQIYQTGSYFFIDPKLMRSDEDIYKKVLLKKFALLSFVYEFRHDIKLNKKSSDLIYKQIKRVEKSLFLKFHNDHFDEDLYKMLNKTPIKTIDYKSYHTSIEWIGADATDEEISNHDYPTVEVKPSLEPKSEEEINKELDKDLAALDLKPEMYKDIDSKLEALDLNLEEPTE